MKLTLDTVRELMGDDAIGLSDAEVTEIRDHAADMARIIIRRSALGERAPVRPNSHEPTPVTASLD